MNPETQQAPLADEYFEYYHNYVRLVPSGDILVVLESQRAELTALLSGVSESDSIVCHAPYAWTLRQVVGHLIDAERTFAERLHRFAAGDVQPVPGIDQDAYVLGYDYSNTPLTALVDELLLLRASNVLLIRRLPPSAWGRRGVASGHPVTVRALAWIMAGHIIHHAQIIRARLKGPFRPHG